MKEDVVGPATLAVQKFHRSLLWMTLAAIGLVGCFILFSVAGIMFFAVARVFFGELGQEVKEEPFLRLMTYGMLTVLSPVVFWAVVFEIPKRAARRYDERKKAPLKSLEDFN